MMMIVVTAVRRGQEQFLILMVFHIMCIWHVNGIVYLHIGYSVSIIFKLSLTSFNIWHKYLETHRIKLSAFKLEFFYESGETSKRYNWVITSIQPGHGQIRETPWHWWDPFHLFSVRAFLLHFWWIISLLVVASSFQGGKYCFIK